MRLGRIVKWTAAALPLAALLAFVVAYARSTNACDRPRPAAPHAPMRAIVYCDYGSSDVLRLDQIEKPVPDSNQVLVRVRAASVNPLDWHFMRGQPYVGRFGMGLRKPSETRIGVDFAGTVEAVGSRVTRFHPGDEVFGARTGAFAEYVTVNAERNVVAKPANVTFEQAAAVPVAALTALQALRDQAHVRAGQKVLVNGASGGVGTFAVQLAKVLGAEVTGVCSTRNAAMVQSLGADHVIDYTKADFTRGTQRYDAIIDMVGTHSVADVRRVLAPTGTYVMVGGPAGRWVAPFPSVLRLMIASRSGAQRMRFFLAEIDRPDLEQLRDLMQSGRVRPVVDRTYDLSDARAAVAYQEAGHARGKVVITVH